jgi:hypothetical protein
MTKAIQFIKTLPIKDRYRIIKSKKAFIVILQDNSYLFTNDLHRYRHEYIKRNGCFAAISALINEI